MQNDYIQNQVKHDQAMVAQISFDKRKDGSLLDLFESPLFDVHKLFSYLHRMDHRPNIMEYLVNKLFTEQRENVKLLDFYLPQLCYMSITKRDTQISIPIERFVLQICIKY